MATSITQARPLLTAAELELFDHSRASPIKALTAKQLAGKEKRVRALRDKYRDLYRRQTVEQRGKSGKSNKGSASVADANARTQRKADIMQEVLERFEARSTQLAASQERAAAAQMAAPKSAAKAPAKAVKTPAGKTVGKAAASKPARSARKPSASQTRAPASQKAAGKPPVKRAAAQPSRPSAPARARKPKDTEQAISACAPAGRRRWRRAGGALHGPGPDAALPQGAFGARAHLRRQGTTARHQRAARHGGLGQAQQSCAPDAWEYCHPGPPKLCGAPRPGQARQSLKAALRCGLYCRPQVPSRMLPRLA